MGEYNKPTEKQKHWLAQVLGPEAWHELTRKPDFVKALETSMGQARKVALHYLAEKERVRRMCGTTE